MAVFFFCFERWEPLSSAMKEMKLGEGCLQRGNLVNKMHKIHFIFKNFTPIWRRGNVMNENVIK
ncbi:hypothetical protein ETC05_06595 [Geobacillus sp. BMUD]|nr:hypothetical protein [Geobacillus sp. BMUD]